MADETESSAEQPNTHAPADGDASPHHAGPIVGFAPAMSLAALYQATAHAMALAQQNAAAAQQQAFIQAQAATTAGVAQLYAIATAATPSSPQE